MDALVLGCGVIGLSTALRLQEAGRRVEIWAAESPPQTTSSVAAAVWYPYRAYPEDRVLAWSRRSYEVFEELARDPTTGVRMSEGIQLWRREVPDPWWRNAVPRFRRATPEELPEGYHAGYVFSTPVIEMPLYLDYLLSRFTAAGGSLKLRRVRSLEEAAGAPAVFNCTGLGSLGLLGDGALTPIRGQVVRTTNPGLTRFVLDEENPAGDTYIIPRSRDCILGGTADEGDWSLEPDPQTAQSILRRCATLEPRLADAGVLEHRVGLRPGRPEVRLERETLPGGTTCIHDYGHGGAGVTVSWGCAEEAVSLLE